MFGSDGMFGNGGRVIFGTEGNGEAVGSVGKDATLGKFGSCNRLREARLVAMLDKDNNATITKRIEQL
ncbi:hypothetical protein RND71_011069 [Anisodus tanguticus]|uniref:Uncharacterized protein n=1 Tax=Anisodus tanguticus TaxID=243964 RepID=A0AAE1SIY0_9SOLA|nr:hypothetical protein RND71_011069 [Anisodus tanguticus]